MITLHEANVLLTQVYGNVAMFDPYLGPIRDHIINWFPDIFALLFKISQSSFCWPVFLYNIGCKSNIQFKHLIVATINVFYIEYYQYFLADYNIIVSDKSIKQARL